MRLAKVGTGSKVLITGGAVSVANYAIQLAQLRDAIVISTVNREAKAFDAEKAGADAIINDRIEDVGRVKALTNGGGVDAPIWWPATTKMRHGKPAPIAWNAHAPRRSRRFPRLSARYWPKVAIIAGTSFCCMPRAKRRPPREGRPRPAVRCLAPDSKNYQAMTCLPYRRCNSLFLVYCCPQLLRRLFSIMRAAVTTGAFRVLRA
jgi:hypothetical protein